MKKKFFMRVFGMIVALSCSVGFFACKTNGCGGQTQILNKRKLTRQIERIAEFDFENNKVFGSGYLVMQKGEVVYKNYFGYASLAKKPLNDTTIFRLASMTKPVTAVATLILVDRGLLSLDDEVAKFIPEYKNVRITKTDGGKLLDLGVAKTAITIRHLLTHTSGIGSNDTEKESFITNEDRKTSLSYAKRFAELGVDFEPGSTQFYSAVAAFSTLGYIIEQVSGQTLQAFYTQEIFEPCGMTNTTFMPTTEQWSRVIDMHGRDENGNTTVQMPDGCVFGNYPVTHCAAGAGLASTMEDYAKFATMLLNKGKTETGRLMKEEVFKEMSTPKVKVDDTTFWGLGVRVIADDNHPYLPKGAFGWSGAYGSHFWIDPSNEIVAVYMKNSTVDGGAGNESATKFEKAVKRALR